MDNFDMHLFFYFRYSDSTNTDILWRYGRVLLEIALWTSSADKNRMVTFLEVFLCQNFFFFKFLFPIDFLNSIRSAKLVNECIDHSNFQAEKIAKKALDYENPQSPNANAHKW